MMRNIFIALAAGALLAAPTFAEAEQTAKPSNTTPAPSIALSQKQVEGNIASAGFTQVKGLEFKAVVVMACDDDILPSGERIDAVVDESDLDDIYETERQLLYVACTRARDRLLVSAVRPGSEFLADLGIISTRSQ